MCMARGIGKLLAASLVAQPTFAEALLPAGSKEGAELLAWWLEAGYIVGDRHQNFSRGHHIPEDEPVEPGEAESSPLSAWFYKHEGLKPQIQKWRHYFDIYHWHFQHLRGLPKINMLVIGVASGGEVDMWRKYFGPGLRYIGIDYNPGCKTVETIYNSDGVRIIIGDQIRWTFLMEIRKAFIGEGLHIILDDGSHMPMAQLVSFKMLFSLLLPYGVYLVEDVAGNGEFRSESFLDYCNSPDYLPAAVLQFCRPFVEHAFLGNVQ
eukprot:TRINITY_DN22072_c0_g1_i4.p1 TRINITY_DN22072_c0_g1~~TRINITY_DN22072_c0_g1_i4.p1  ORF type:complete len:264 (+),score=13.79 TRINITY_DN22072_c0_g1_i4:84-875(+)